MLQRVAGTAQRLQMVNAFALASFRLTRSCYHLLQLRCYLGAIDADITLPYGYASGAVRSMINQRHVAHEGLGVLRWLAVAAAVTLPFLLMYVTQIR
jgi:hypothetical protein